jgi:hypothetical protein
MPGNHISMMDEEAPPNEHQMKKISDIRRTTLNTVGSFGVLLMMKIRSQS